MGAPSVWPSSFQLIAAAALASGLLPPLTPATGHAPHCEVEGPGHGHSHVGGQGLEPAAPGPPSSLSSPCRTDRYGQLVVCVFTCEINTHLWSSYPHGHKPGSGTSGEGDQVLPRVLPCPGAKEAKDRQTARKGSRLLRTWGWALQPAAPRDLREEGAGSEELPLTSGAAQRPSWGSGPGGSDQQVLTATPTDSSALLGPTCSLLPAPWEENARSQTSTNYHRQESAEILL